MLLFLSYEVILQPRESTDKLQLTFDAGRNLAEKNVQKLKDCCLKLGQAR
jgi:hypothetical protein